MGNLESPLINLSISSASTDISENLKFVGPTAGPPAGPPAGPAAGPPAGPMVTTV